MIRLFSLKTVVIILLLSAFGFVKDDFSGNLKSHTKISPTHWIQLSNGSNNSDIRLISIKDLNTGISETYNYYSAAGEDNLFVGPVQWISHTPYTSTFEITFSSDAPACCHTFYLDYGSFSTYQESTDTNGDGKLYSFVVNLTLSQQVGLLSLSLN